MKLVKKIDQELGTLMTCKRRDDYVLLPDEEDITSVEMLERAMPWELNYAEIKDCYQYLGKNFSSLSDKAKDRVVQFCAVDMNTCIAHYVSKGMTESSALASYIDDRCNGIVKLIAVCESNIKDSQLIITLLSFMSQEQAEKFLDATHKLIYLYTSFAVYGKKYGNYIDGILDYVEDYGDFSGKGLSTYTLYPGKDLSDLVAAMVKLLTNDRSNIV